MSRPADRSWTTALIACASVFLLLVAAAVVVALQHERARTLADGRRMAGNLAKVLEEQTSRTFQAVDLTLIGIQDTLRHAPALPEHDLEFRNTLRRRLASLPHVGALFVVGPDGFIRHSTDDPFAPRESLADRGYFIAHVRNPAVGLHIGPPLVSRAVATWFVSMSRRIDNPDGSFGGIVAAAVEPSYFERFYQSLQLSEGDAIALFERDGTLITRHPPRSDLIGQSFAHQNLFRRYLPESGVGVFWTASFFDGIRRIVGYQTVEGLPLVVAIGLSEDALLAEWRRSAIGGAVAVGLLTLLVATVMLLLVRNYRQREQARQRLVQAQRLEALGRMTGGLAHDFNNLLTVVSGGLDLIRRRADNESIRRSAEMAADAATRAAQLTAQLLAFARKQQLTVQAVDVNALISGMEHLLGHAAGSKVRLVFDLAPDLWPCMVDQAQLDSAILNLVVNARDSMPDGGSVRIATANRRAELRTANGGTSPGDCVRVTVADTGQGMPPEVLQRALEPFFTTKEGAGTGLGLSQVYGFVRQVGGDLRIESQVNVGTQVHLFFRRARDGAPGPGPAGSQAARSEMP